LYVVLITDLKRCFKIGFWDGLSPVFGGGFFYRCNWISNIEQKNIEFRSEVRDHTYPKRASDSEQRAPLRNSAFLVRYTIFDIHFKQVRYNW